MAVIVNIEKSLSVVGNKASLACDMLQMLLDSLPEDQRLINQAFDKKDFDALLFKTHRLHGATLYCGVPQLTSICYRLETLLKGNQQTEINEALVELNQAIDDLFQWASNNDWQTLFTED